MCACELHWRGDSIWIMHREIKTHETMERLRKKKLSQCSCVFVNINFDLIEGLWVCDKIYISRSARARSIHHSREASLFIIHVCNTQTLIFASFKPPPVVFHVPHTHPISRLNEIRKKCTRWLRIAVWKKKRKIPSNDESYIKSVHLKYIIYPPCRCCSHKKKIFKKWTLW